MYDKEFAAALVKRIQNKDGDALETAVRRYTGYVMAVLRKVAVPPLSQEDVEELASDTFITLWKKAGSLRDPSALKAFLAQTARNAAIDRLRQRKETFPLEDRLICASPLPDTTVTLREQAQIVAAAVEAMEPTRRACMIYRYYYGEELAAIAKRLNLPLSTVKSHIYRGRRRLLDTLNEWGYSYEENNKFPGALS